MDFGRSISYVRQDPGWIGKVILGSIISIIPIVNFAAYGYMLDVIRNVYEGRETPLPEWGDDFGGRFVRGFMFLVISLIYLLPAIIIYFIFFAVVGGAAATASQEQAEAAAGGLGIAALCLLPIIFIAFLVLGMMSMIAGARYALTRDFGSAMRFGEVFAEFRNNLGTWGMLILYSIIMQLALGLIVAITCGIGFLVSFYAIPVLAHLIAQAHRQSTGGMVTEPARY